MLNKKQEGTFIAAMLFFAWKLMFAVIALSGAFYGVQKVYEYSGWILPLPFSINGLILTLQRQNFNYATIFFMMLGFKLASTPKLFLSPTFLRLQSSLYALVALLAVTKQLSYEAWGFAFICVVLLALSFLLERTMTTVPTMLLPSRFKARSSLKDDLTLQSTLFNKLGDR